MKRQKKIFAVRAAALLLCASLCLGGCQVVAPVPEQGASANPTTTTTTTTTTTEDTTTTVSHTTTTTTATTTQTTTKKTTTGTTLTKDGTLAPLASPVYPKAALNPRLEDVTLTDEEKSQWYAQRNNRYDLAKEYGAILNAYLTGAVPTFLRDDKQQNRVVSPLNIYLALGMLTEITAGNTRDQLLELLDAPDQATMRKRANGLWNAAYQKDGTVTGLLASSLWLRDKFSYKQAPLTQLAETYYASAYRGRMGSAAYDRTLQKWLDDNTGGLLSEYAKQQTLDEDTVIAMATTIYFSAKWDEGFREGNTAPRAFYAPDKTVTCDFMNDERKTDYVDGEGFCAVAIALEQSGYMWVFLPDEGVSPETLPARQAVWDVAQGKTTGDYRTVTLALPKFDVSSEFDLCDGLKALGVTDIMNRQKADFSPLFDKSANPLTDAELSKAPHAARVKIDEEGCEAAAFTLTAMTGAAAPQPEEPIPFVADRPFFFVITGEGNLPLFAGTVYNP